MTKATQTGILESYKPHLIQLEENLVAAIFPFMKIFPAEFCLRRAEEEGWIKPQHLVVETSSGNMALGLAIICNLKNYRLMIVSDYAVEGFLRRRLEDLGAQVEIVFAPAVQGGYQRARLDKIEEIRAKTAEHWWVNQYDNPGNPGAYGAFAAQLVQELGRVDCLVGTVGSGGSVCGTGSFLRELFPEMKIIGIDTFGSVLFGQPDQVRALRGLGNSILPGNLDHSMFDEVHWVSASEAYKATRVLHQKTSLFCGGTSGAAWLVARYWARRNPGALVVCICPDDGYRYTETIYSDEYLLKNELWLPELPQLPRVVHHPLEAASTWSVMKWGRRTYNSVMGQPSSMATAATARAID